MSEEGGGGNEGGGRERKGEREGRRGEGEREGSSCRQTKSLRLSSLFIPYIYVSPINLYTLPFPGKKMVIYIQVIRTPKNEIIILLFVYTAEAHLSISKYDDSISNVHKCE